jgi:ribosomal protein S17E
MRKLQTHLEKEKKIKNEVAGYQALKQKTIRVGPRLISIKHCLNPYVTVFNIMYV